MAVGALNAERARELLHQRDDFLGRNDRSEKKREAELKLILSGNFKGWNVAENLIAEKNLAGVS